MTKALTSEYEEPTEATFHFREKSKVQPEGLGSIQADQQVTIILEGKVTAFNTHSWDNGKSFTVTLSSCKITTPAETASGLDDAVEAAKQSRKKVK